MLSVYGNIKQASIFYLAANNTKNQDRVVRTFGSDTITSRLVSGSVAKRYRVLNNTLYKMLKLKLVWDDQIKMMIILDLTPMSTRSRQLAMPRSLWRNRVI